MLNWHIIISFSLMILSVIIEKCFMIKYCHKDPTIYLVNSNKSDPTQAPEGHENLKVLPHIPYIQNQPFTEEQYSDFRERVLDKLEKWGLQTYVNISYMKIFDATRY